MWGWEGEGRAEGAPPREICVGLRGGEAISSVGHSEGLRVRWDPCGGQGDHWTRLGHSRGKDGVQQGDWGTVDNS